MRFRVNHVVGHGKSEKIFALISKSFMLKGLNQESGNSTRLVNMSMKVMA